MIEPITIRRAITDDSDRLTELSFESKRYWNYPPDYMARWEKELTITRGYIDTNHVFIAKAGDEAVGFYSLVDIEKDLNFGTIVMEKGIWLDHMFVHPDRIGKGIGTALMRHMTDFLRTISAHRVLIFVDPHADGFYKKMGATLLRYSDSSIPGRQIPVYEYEVC